MASFTVAVTNTTTTPLSIKLGLLPGISRSVSIPAGRTVHLDRDLVIGAITTFRDLRAKGFITFQDGDLFDGMGVTGFPGSTGIDGATGALGETGLQGETGERGPTGWQGETGLQGPRGHTGFQGFQGDTGVGDTGLPGPTGAQGVTGVQGATGVGATGPHGTTGMIGPGGSTGTVGPQGSTGIRGATGLRGPTGPANGPAGETGPQGPQGVTGPGVGDQGATGVEGPQGATGLSGPTGLPGPTGPGGGGGGSFAVDLSSNSTMDASSFTFFKRSIDESQTYAISGGTNGASFYIELENTGGSTLNVGLTGVTTTFVNPHSRTKLTVVKDASGYRVISTKRELQTGDSLPSTDNSITRMIKIGNDLFMCGSFESTFKTVHGVAPVDGQGKLLDFLRLNLSGIILAMYVQDDVLYVGGSLYIPVIGDETQSRQLVAIDLNTGNFLEGFGAKYFGSDVRCITGLGNQPFIYVGGGFDNFEGVPAERLVKLHAKTGRLVQEFSTYRGFNSTVLGIVVDHQAECLYVVGDFTSYKGVTRQNVAKINAVSADLDLAFDSSSGFNNFCEDVISHNGFVYVVGNFTSYGGTACERLAKLDGVTGTLAGGFDTTTGFNNSTYSILKEPNKPYIFVGGSFTEYKAVSSPGLAKINIDDASLDGTFSVGTGVDGEVNELKLIGEQLYIGGNFSVYNGVSRPYAARLDPVSGTLDSSYMDNGTFNSQVAALEYWAKGNVILYGGWTINGFENKIQIGLAKMDTKTGEFYDFVLGNGFDGTVYDMAYDESISKFYLVGSFSTYNGVSAPGIARIDAVTGALDLTFDPGIGFNGSAYVVVLDGTSIIVGGGFTTYDGTGAQRIVKILQDGTIGSTFDTQTAFDGEVFSLALGEGDLFVGGNFTVYNGVPVMRLAKLNNTTAALDLTFDTDPGFNGDVLSILIDGSDVIVGGGFTDYGGTPRNRIAKVDAGTAVLNLSFANDFGFDDTVRAITQDGQYLFVAGNFTSYNRVPCFRLAKLHVSTGGMNTMFDTRSSKGSAAVSLLVDGNTLWVGSDEVAIRDNKLVGSIYKVSSQSAKILNILPWERVEPAMQVRPLLNRIVNNDVVYATYFATGVGPGTTIAERILDASPPDGWQFFDGTEPSLDPDMAGVADDLVIRHGAGIVIYAVVMNENGPLTPINVPFVSSQFRREVKFPDFNNLVATDAEVTIYLAIVTEVAP